MKFLAILFCALATVVWSADPKPPAGPGAAPPVNVATAPSNVTAAPGNATTANGTSPADNEKPDADDLLSVEEKKAICSAAQAEKDNKLCATKGAADEACNKLAKSINGTLAKCVSEHICGFKVPPSNETGTTEPSPTKKTRRRRRDAPTTGPAGAAPPAGNGTTPAATGATNAPVTIEDQYVYVSGQDFADAEVVKNCGGAYSIIVPGGKKNSPGPVNGTTPAAGGNGPVSPPGVTKQ